jgi:hypothetical protein
VKSFQYTAHCGRCLVVRALTRGQVETGRNPICDGCGGAMVVYSGTGTPPAAATDKPADAVA